MNAMLGGKLSIVSPKAQTTRHRIRGIWNEENFQVVFCDTPGYIARPAYKLQQRMNDYVEEAFTDADVVLLVTDKYQSLDAQAPLIERLQNTQTPVVVAINKTDLCTPVEAQELYNKWHEKLPHAHVFLISAQYLYGVTELKNKLTELLPESPPYFDKEHLSDRAVRFFVAEILREKIFELYEKEIPYSCEVTVDEYREQDALDYIRCVIYTERESQKIILIGKDGRAIKKLGIEARKQIEEFLGKKVHLELYVKVQEKWRNDERALHRFGYEI